MEPNVWINVRDNGIVGTPFGPIVPNGRYVRSDDGGSPSAADYAVMAWQPAKTAPKDALVIAYQVPTARNATARHGVVIPMYVDENGVFCKENCEPDPGIGYGFWIVTH